MPALDSITLKHNLDKKGSRVCRTCNRERCHRYYTSRLVR